METDSSQAPSFAHGKPENSATLMLSDYPRGFRNPKAGVRKHGPKLPEHGALSFVGDA